MRVDGPWLRFLSLWTPWYVVDWWFRWHTLGSDGLVHRMSKAERREMQDLVSR
jgi:hypothetical protein